MRPPARAARVSTSYAVRVRATSGVGAAAEAVVDIPLGHGQDPAVLLARAGWRIERPLAATRDGEAIVLEFAVRAASPCSPPQRLAGAEPVRLAGGATSAAARDPALALAPGEEPARRQRVSAAALVVTDVPVGVADSAGRRGPGGRCVLATQYAGAAIRWEGSWGLPGGGIDDGEQPAQAARREAFEETGQDVAVGALAFVQSAHWVGRSPAGVAEDFHAVRLVFLGDCAAPRDVVVHDAGGTTSAAAWVPVAAAGELAWAPGPREQLRALRVLP